VPKIDAVKIFPSLHDIPREFRIDKFSGGLSYLVNGEVLTAAQGIEVRSPLMLRQQGAPAPYILGEYADLNREEARAALDAAEKAWASGMGTWPRMTAAGRINCMEEFVKRIRPLEKDFALLEMWEIGRPYPACRDEFRRTLQYIEDTVAALKIMEKEARLLKRVDDFIYQVRRCALGICLCLGPFNYPLNETFAMLIPALLTGNTLVVKLPKYGSLCTIPLLEAFARSFPAGVINIINGDGQTIITPIIESGKVSVLGFIGSTRVANLLIGQHPANNRLRTILGLEAKNPAFIFPDADIELTVRECINGALEFNGQRCTSLKHIWVHSSIADEFLAAMSRAVEQLVCGMPWEEGAMITPLPETGKCEWLSHLVEDACQKGARVVNAGGGQVYGNLFYPAIVFPVDPDMELYQVEQFGPLIPVTPFTRMEELTAYLAASDYGQQASIFTSSPHNAAPLIDGLANQVSRINLNAQCRRGPDQLPFTGRKDSAEGTLSVSDALRSFSVRSLAVANEQGRELFFDVLKSNRSKFLNI